jgi:broad specificity phosphatase PhoE
MSWEQKRKQEEVIIECDPQLSRPNGKEQAKQTAEFLAGALEDDYGVVLEEAEIFIFSSPFLACVESAAAIAKSFDVSTINIQD